MTSALVYTLARVQAESQLDIALAKCKIQLKPLVVLMPVTCTTSQLEPETLVLSIQGIAWKGSRRRGAHWLAAPGDQKLVFQLALVEIMRDAATFHSFMCPVLLEVDVTGPVCS